MKPEKVASADRLNRFNLWFQDFGKQEIKKRGLDVLTPDKMIAAAYAIYEELYPFPHEYYRIREPNRQKFDDSPKGKSLPLLLILGSMLAMLALIGLLLFEKIF